MIDATIFSQAGALNSNNLTLANNPGTGVLGSISFINPTAPTGQQRRWVLSEDASAESGGNAGSNFSLVACSDSGSGLTTPIYVSRASGAVTFGGATTTVGAATFSSITASGTATFNGTTNFNGAVNFGSTLNAANISANGSVTAAYLSSTGALYVAGAATISAALTVNNDATVNNLILPTNGLIAYQAIGADLTVDGTGSWDMAPGPSGNFNLQRGTAYKPGGGAWATLSDARIKDVTGEYEMGLDEVLQLRPVSYRYKTGADKEFVGLVAQEAETVFPSMVSQRDGVIDGEKVSDLRELDTSELVYALLNSIKMLNQKIQSLEAKVDSLA